MSINENDRLDLRQELERIFNNPRIAEIAMEAMPPIDYSQLAYKRDLDALGTRLDGEIAELRGEMQGEFGKIRSEAANNLRLMIASQFATTALIMGWVSAST